ncbi:MAG: squalene/phytoene synthase family protein, partial [Pseudomonadota bacterium]
VALGRVVERLLDAADEIYERALTGLSDLPATCRPGIRAAGMVYAGIGSQVRANGFNSVDHRAYTTRAHKVRLLVASISKRDLAGNCDESPALAEVNYLVDAAVDEAHDPRGTMEWLVDLNTKLARRDRGLETIR